MTRQLSEVIIPSQLSCTTGNTDCRTTVDLHSPGQSNHPETSLNNNFNPETAELPVTPPARQIPEKPDASMDSGPRTGDDAGPRAEAGQPPAATAERSKLWFDETVVVPDAFRDLLVNYSHVAPGDVDEHVIEIVSVLAPFAPLSFSQNTPQPSHLLTETHHTRSGTRHGRSTTTRA